MKELKLAEVAADIAVDEVAEAGWHSCTGGSEVEASSVPAVVGVSSAAAAVGWSIVSRLARRSRWNSCQANSLHMGRPSVH